MARELEALFAPVAVSIILFGSAARGEDVPGSDVDVLSDSPMSFWPLPNSLVRMVVGTPWN